MEKTMLRKQNQKPKYPYKLISRLIMLVIGLALFIMPADISRFSVSADEEENPWGKLDLDPIHSENWTAVLYDASNGMLTSDANDIAETRDGFLWIASYSGLIRYDGYTFERFAASEGISSARSLYVDSKNRLWIGTNNKGIYMMENGTFRNWNTEAGLQSLSIRDIVEDNSGTIYAATTGGLIMIDKDLNISLLDDSRVRNEFIVDLEKDGSSRIYGMTLNGDVFTMKYGTLISFFEHESSGFPEGISNIFPDPTNTNYLYFETKDNQLHYGSIISRFNQISTIDISPLNEVQDFKYINGRIWICARNGIGVLENGTFRLLENVPMTNSIVNMTQDYEGNLWFASSRQGVMKIVPNRFANVSERYGMPPMIINSTCMYNDLLFAASDNNGLFVLNREDMETSLPLDSFVTASGEEVGANDLLDFLQGMRIRSLYKDSNNRLWLSIWRNYGLICYDGDARSAVLYTTNDGLISDQVRTVIELADGTIAAALTGGVNLIRDGQVTAGYTASDGLINTEILNVAEGENGDILCGSDGDGIFVIHSDGSVESIRRDDGQTLGSVMRIKPDRERGIYWIVTGNYLAYMNSDYHVTEISHFPFTNNFDIYENDSGEMWVLSSNGIYVAAADDLLSDEPFETRHFSMSNGLPSIATANSYSDLLADGTLYIAGTAGINRVNINEYAAYSNQLKITVPYVDADEERIYPDKNGSFHIPHTVRKLQIYIHVMNFSLNDPQISYRLEGFDAKYMAIDADDLGHIVYTNLDGGTYALQIQVTDPLTNSKQSTYFSITKQRAFYEQKWFYIAAVTLFAAALVLGIREYVNYRIRKLEEKHKEEAEKERIATELNMASRIQHGALPTRFPAYPERSDFDLYAVMDPAREVGGDFYDFFLIDDTHLGLVIADVSGKGIPAALFMMISKTILKSFLQFGNEPADALTLTNETLCSQNDVQMFVSVWAGVLDLSTGILKAANAGHEFPAVKITGEFELLKDRHGLVLGAMDGVPYTQYEIAMKPGDKVFVYTDGVAEAMTKKNEMFGTDRMLEALNADGSASPQALLETVRDHVNAFVSGAEQFDDLTMLCVQYNGPDAKEH